MGPPLIGPIWRSPALSAMPVRFGVIEGFCARHWFHERGPRRNASTCLESADNATHATTKERNSHERGNRQQQTTPTITLLQTPRHRQAESRGNTHFGSSAVASSQRAGFRQAGAAPPPSIAPAKNEEPPAGGSLRWRIRPAIRRGQSQPGLAADARRARAAVVPHPLNGRAVAGQAVAIGLAVHPA